MYKNVIKYMRKINWKYSLLLVAVLVASIIIIKPSPLAELKLKFKNGKPLQYVFDKKYQSQLSQILSEALGSTFNLSWYNVCFYNKSTVTQHGVITTPVILAIYMFPLNTNKALLDLQEGLKILPQLEDEQSESSFKKISGEIIYAPYNSRNCSLISASEGGFEYELSLVQVKTDQYGTPITIPTSLPNIGTLSPYPLDTGPVEESRQLSLANSTLEVKTNSFALWISRIVFIILVLGFWESLKKICKAILRSRMT